MTMSAATTVTEGSRTGSLLMSHGLNTDAGLHAVHICSQNTAHLTFPLGYTDICVRYVLIIYC